jgi:hypothetical protein
MKSAFKQAIEDIGYGMSSRAIIVPRHGQPRGRSDSRFAGLVLRNPLLLGLSAFCFACTAAEYQIHGSNIRRSWKHLPPVNNSHNDIHP